MVVDVLVDVVVVEVGGCSVDVGVGSVVVVDVVDVLDVVGSAVGV